jgi:Peptidase family M28
MYKNIIITAFLLRGVIATAQQADPAPFANTIQPQVLRTHLTVLTADSLEGRETGTKGNYKAAEYIARQFQAMGLPTVGKDNSYFQKMVYTNEGWNQINMSLNEKSYRHQFNFYALPGMNPSVEKGKIEANDIVYLGYGIEDKKYSDYRKANIKGKVILIHKGEPINSDSISLISKSKDLSPWATDDKMKLALAYKKGVKAVLIIDPELNSSIKQNRQYFNRSFMGDIEKPDGKYANSLYISPDMARDIIGEKSDAVKELRAKIAKGKPKSLVLPCNIQITMDKFFNQLIGNNVLGYIEGTDPLLKNELVIVSAHYDHLGKRGEEIYHGADDNGSGTSTVLEITQSLVEAKAKGIGPRRSVLCMLVTGEEKGLLGSKYYTRFPVFPLENTVANVNIDMVGRVDDKYKDNPNYIYVIGADKLSSELHTINEQANATYTKLTLDYTYNDENDPNRYYYRSDHYNFAVMGIPAIFYFNGTHDDYHRTSDTIDKINFDKMAQIAKLAFYTTWEIANRDARLRVDKK